jgi:adenylate cyclase
MCWKGRTQGGRPRSHHLAIDAETGTHIWADKYDGALTDVFDLQDQITDRVVGIVEPSLQRSEIERSRRKRPETLDAYDLYLRAMPHIAAQMPEDLSTALPLLEEALRLEPDYAAAHAHLAWSYELRFTRGGLNEPDKIAALRHARATLSGGTDDATALAVAGFVTCLLGLEHEAALNAIDRALAINASCATALHLGAQAQALAARGEKATAFAHRALRLSPFDPLAFEAHMALGEIALLEEPLRGGHGLLRPSDTDQSEIQHRLFQPSFFTGAGGTHGRIKTFGRARARTRTWIPFRLPHRLRIAPPLLEQLRRGARLCELID